MLRPVVLFVFVAIFSYVSVSTEVCTSAFIPGAKGDQGEIGDDGDEGKLGKDGPPGLPGVPGESGLKGEVGHVGKMGPTGDRGDKGDKGVDGPAGLKGETGPGFRVFTSGQNVSILAVDSVMGHTWATTYTCQSHVHKKSRWVQTKGTTCDCGRYRKVVGQLDVNVGKLGNAVKFVKSVVLGLRETDERYYLLVKEPKRFREALMNCKLRGGTLAMPKTSNTNRLMADYISQAGLTRVYIGVQPQTKHTDGTSSHVYVDSSPLQGFESWSQDEELQSNTNSSCVELLSTETWAHVECEATMFFICEFPKSRRRGGGRGAPASASS